MLRKAFACFLAILILGAFAAGCGEGGSDPVSPDPRHPDTTITLAPAVGGTVALADGAAIIFPAGSLSDTAEITVEEIADPAPTPAFADAMGPAYTFTIETHGVTFTTATIRLPLPGRRTGDGLIVEYVEQTDEWAITDGRDTGDGFVEQTVAPSVGRQFIIGTRGAVDPLIVDPLPPSPPPIAPPPPVPSPEMTSIPGGTFFMGSSSGWDSERPVHPVHVDDFAAGVYEVTNSDFCSFLIYNGNQFEDGFYWLNTADPECRIDQTKDGRAFEVESGYENHPVCCVAPQGSMAYCNWLSESYGLQNCHGPFGNRGVIDITKSGYRLLTEAEWEYAATLAHGDSRPYSWGTADFDAGSPQENTGSGLTGTTPVGSYASSGWWGLYDMGGNVTELVGDWLEYDYYETSGSDNPVGPSSSSVSLRAVRGANYMTYYESHMRVAMRNGMYMGSQIETFGFRIGRSE